VTGSIELDHDNGDCFGRFLGGTDGHLIVQKQEVDFLFYKFIYKAGDPIQFAFAMPMLNQKVLALNIA
jgi:hypothetical protein